MRNEDWSMWWRLSDYWFSVLTRITNLNKIKFLFWCLNCRSLKTGSMHRSGPDENDLVDEWHLQSEPFREGFKVRLELQSIKKKTTTSMSQTDKLTKRLSIRFLSKCGLIPEIKTDRCKDATIISYRLMLILVSYTWIYYNMTNYFLRFLRNSKI